MCGNQNCQESESAEGINLSFMPVLAFRELSLSLIRGLVYIHQKITINPAMFIIWLNGLNHGNLLTD